MAYCRRVGDEGVLSVARGCGRLRGLDISGLSVRDKTSTRSPHSAPSPPSPSLQMPQPHRLLLPLPPHSPSSHPSPSLPLPASLSSSLPRSHLTMRIPTSRHHWLQRSPRSL
ncbi:hypothetical protein BC829DRAFT_26517 [Chytridium lagenaria]|nr:hypothetical protein BC829DRAFT_26517 [Chytridium lagenaria]